MQLLPVFPILFLAAATLAAQTAGGPVELLREAARLDEQGKCAEAEQKYRQVLAAEQQTVAVWNNFGNHFVTCGDLEKARPWFERVLQANPKHSNANLQMARVELGRRNGRAALERLDRAGQSGPAVDLLRAEALALMKDRDGAAAVLARLDGAAQADPAVAFQLGLTYGRLGMFEQAEAAFNLVLARYPNDPDVLLNVGKAAARAGRFDRAQRALETALRLRPGDGRVLWELGLTEGERGDFAKAVFYLAQASQADPKNPEKLLALARASESAGFYGDAALAYDRYLTMRPGDDVARRDRGLMYGLTEKRAAEGRRDLEEYIRRHPNDPIGHFYLAQLLWREEAERALVELGAAIGAQRDYAPALLARGWLLARMGKTAEALPDLEAAVHAAPGNARAMVELGRARLAAGKAAEAEAVLAEAMKAAPGDAETLLQLGRAQMAQGREAEAQKTLERYQSARGPAPRGPRKEPGMIALAGLPPAEGARREIERLTREAGAHPGDAELQAGLAGLLLANGQTRGALAAYEELLRRPVVATVWLKAGRVLLSAGEYAMARRFLDGGRSRVDLALATLMTEGPAAALTVLDGVADGERDSAYRLARARVLEALGKRADAERELNQALGTGGGRPEWAVAAARMLLGMGRAQQAVTVLRGAGPEADVQLTLAVALSAAGDRVRAEATLRAVESRWPEWDAVYVARGLLAGRGTPEGKKSFGIAVALGSRDPAAACGASGGEGCECWADLVRWAAGRCRQ